MERLSPGASHLPLAVLLLLAASVGVGGITDNGFVVQVEGVTGRSVDLPCDTSTHSADDQAVLVLWYRNDDGTPMYNFDARGGRTLSEGSVERDLFPGARATFVADRDPPALRLQAVTADDQALYRCRVDFKSSPTRNQRVNLTVIVPPSPPEILHRGQLVVGSVGPMEEGATLHLVCRSNGGQPTPRIVWLRGGREVNSSAESSSDGRVYCELHLPPLTRADLHMRLTCSASNTNFSRPAASDVEVDMNFRPLSVEMLGSSLHSMSSEQSYELLCRSHGSRPPANISWWIGGTRLTGDQQTASGRGNVSSSSVTFRPSAAFHGRPLVCRAENERVTNGIIEDRRTLSIRYAPRVSLRLGDALDPKNIPEGADVYFDCKIEANPKIYSVKWSHEDVPVEASSQTGVSDIVIVNDRSLVIRNLSRRAAGNYICSASNPEGEGASEPVRLTVRYAPVCRPGQQSRYGVTRSQPTLVTCHVDANPSDVTFNWRFNSSLETLDLSNSQVVSRGETSTISFLPRPDEDYGQIICLASNEVGRMVQPCVFNAVAAGRPEPLRDCLVVNQTSEALSVHCEAGFDGGLAQRFVAELREAAGRRLLRNLTQPRPRFAVRQLPAGLQLRLELYAVNSRGRSDPVLLQGLTLKAAEKRVSNDAGSTELEEVSMTPVVGVLIGVILSLLLIAAGVVACLRTSHAGHKSETQADLVTSSLRVKVGPGPGPGAGADTTRPTYRPAVPDQSYQCEPDDRNPDVVPNRHDPEYGAAEASRPSIRHDEYKEIGPASNTCSSLKYPARNGMPLADGAVFSELTLPRGHGGGRAHGREHGPEHDGAVLYATLRRGRGAPAACSALGRTVRPDTDQESVV